MLQTEWNWMVAADLFLSGAGAITLALIAILYLTRSEKHRQTIALGAWIGTIAVGIGVLLLLADVGQQLRALNMFASFSNFATSWMPRGAWALACTIVCGLLLALGTTPALHKRLPALETSCEKAGVKIALKVIAVILILVGCFVSFYTGMLVMSSEGIPFWATPFVPACFVCASIMAGTAIVNALVATRKERDFLVVRILATISLVCALLLAVLLYFYLESMLGGHAAAASTTTAHDAAAYLVYGDCAALFWGGLIVVGIAGTALCDAVVIAVTFSEKLAKTLPGFAIAACACAVIGGFILRWLVLAGGLHPQVLVPGQYQTMGGSMFDGVTFLHQ